MLTTSESDIRLGWRVLAGMFGCVDLNDALSSHGPPVHKLDEAALRAEADLGIPRRIAARFAGSLTRSSNNAAAVLIRLAGVSLQYDLPAGRFTVRDETVWHRICAALDPDLILAVYAASAGGPIECLDDHQPTSGIVGARADVHVHVNAVCPSGLGWSYHVLALTAPPRRAFDWLEPARKHRAIMAAAVGHSELVGSPAEIVTSERRLLYRAWRQLRSNAVLASSFWHYVILKAKFTYAQCHQRSEGGLDGFSAHFRKAASARPEPRHAAQALAWWLATHGLARADLRVSPRDLGLAPPGTTKVLTRSRSVGFGDSLGRRYRAERDEANLFAAQIRSHSSAVSRVDVQGAEHQFHPERWRPAWLAAKCAGLGITLHLGEDFEDLLGGLRVIDEGLTELQRHFDPVRLSHVIAARYRADHWYAARGPVHVTAWEHLLSLTWLTRAPRPAAAVAERERERVLNDWLTHDPKAAGFLASNGRDLPLDPPLHAATWGGRYWVFDPNASLVRVIRSAQRALVKRLNDDEVIIEICPTSNALISRAGQSRALRPASRGASDRLRYVVIGSDDPGLMATDVALEEQLAMSAGLLTTRDMEQARARALALA